MYECRCILPPWDHLWLLEFVLGLWRFFLHWCLPLIILYNATEYRCESLVTISIGRRRGVKPNDLASEPPATLITTVVVAPEEANPQPLFWDDVVCPLAHRLKIPPESIVTCGPAYLQQDLSPLQTSDPLVTFPDENFIPNSEYLQHVSSEPTLLPTQHIVLAAPGPSSPSRSSQRPPPVPSSALTLRQIDSAPKPKLVLRTDNAPQITTPRPPPAATIIFPFPSDHLLTLIHFNVCRALITNILVLNIQSAFPDCAAFHEPKLPSPALIPQHLRPTPLQLAVPHAHWIDIFPHPIVRDNLIRAGAAVDIARLCADIVGDTCSEREASLRDEQGRGADGEMQGVIVWADPWDARNWEMTEGFLRKWGWMMRGAEDLVEVSNGWREMRGEERLVVEVF